MKYRVQVNTYGDPADSWASNGIKYDNKDTAIAAADDLFDRWTAVKFWRVIDDMNTVAATGP